MSEENSAHSKKSPKIGNEDLALYLRIISYLRPYIPHIVLVLIFNFLFVIFNTLSVWMVAPVISALFKEQPQQEQVLEEEPLQTETPSPAPFNLNAWLKHQVGRFLEQGDRVETLKLLCLFIVFTFLLKNFFAYLEFYWVSYVEQKVVKNLREEVYRHVLQQSLSFFDRHDTGGIISRITNDINQVNVAVNRSFTKIIRDPVLIILFVVLLFSISWQLSLVALIVFPLSTVVIQRIGKSLRRKSRRVQERISDITGLLQETISGIKVVKAFAMEDYEDEKFKHYSERHFRAILRRVRLHRLSSPLSESLGVGVMASVLWFGGSLVLEGQLLSSEDFIRFVILLFAMMDPIKSLGDLNNNIQIALASGKRIFDLLDTPIEISDKPNALAKKTFQRDICFEEVYFRYDTSSDWVIKDFTLRIKKHQKIAFVGSSGAGKTTILSLLPRFYEPQKGRILIDGLDIRDLKLADLRRLMGIVTQEVVLFNDTIARNIAYGKGEFSMEQVEHAARLANAYEFITKMPRGFDTVIGERGMLLSGGQRQRISIARAILKNPPILIFDEATSSLDSESEFLIQEAIENLMKDRTVLIIAHRLSSIIKSDIIVVMENGEIVDQGSNKELLERSERYRHLYKLQFANSTSETN